MRLHERQEKILELLASQQKMSTNAFSAEFDVSRETIRRDLLEMEVQGVLLRVHGGARTFGTAIEPEGTFAQRQEQFHEQKKAIAQPACDLIPRNSTCFVDAGTTTSAFARAVAARGDIRIIPSSLDIAQIVSGGQNCDVLLLGGRTATCLRPTGNYPVTDRPLSGRFRGDLAHRTASEPGRDRP